MIMSRIPIAVRAAFSLVLTMLVVVAGVGAQEVQSFPQVAELGEQSLRAYSHVFVAYAITIVMIGGWAISIARRLRGIEDRLVD